MKTLFLKLFSTCIFLTISANGAAKSYVADSKTPKPRIVIMTDIGPGDVEPDDMESAVRLLAYADRFEIEHLLPLSAGIATRTLRIGLSICIRSLMDMGRM